MVKFEARVPGQSDILLAFLAGLVLLLSSLPTLSGLGFYADDWLILQLYRSDPAASIFHWAPHEIFMGRPVQAIYLAALERAFGLEPLCYHLLNTAVLAVAVGLLHLLLRRLGVGRREAFAAACIFAVMPQLSTARVWYATFQIPLALLLSLGSLHALISWHRARRWWLLVVAVLCSVIAALAYETFIPFIAFAPLPLIFRLEGRAVRLREDWKKNLPALALPLAMIGCMLFKLLTVTRVGVRDPLMYAKVVYNLFRPNYDWQTANGINIFAAFQFGLVEPLFGWVRAITAPSMASWVAAAIACVIAAFVGLRRGCHGPAPYSRLLLLALLAFFLGHAFYLVVPYFSFSYVGIANRGQVGSAIGAALLFVCIFRVVAALCGARWRTFVFGALVVVTVGLGALRTAQVLGYWERAYAEQKAFLANAASDLAPVPNGSSVIVDGICPYDGPAVRLESWISVGPSLSLATGKSLRGDTFTSGGKLTSAAITTTIYGDTRSYEYGPALFVYDAARRKVWPIGGSGAAVSYTVQRRQLNCAGVPGQGIRI